MSLSKDEGAPYYVYHYPFIIFMRFRARIYKKFTSLAAAEKAARDTGNPSIVMDKKGNVVTEYGR